MNKTSSISKLSMQPAHKLSFILRLWCSSQAKTGDWRASLEIPETGKRIGFANLEQLFAFLIDTVDSNCALQTREDNDKAIAK